MMESKQAGRGAADPAQSYVRPIRSVLFVDDQFPTYGEPNNESKHEEIRARALWRACTARGWLCDMDSAVEWSTPAHLKRLSACDLLVLDYHLAMDDPTPALRIIHQLAKAPAPNLVVIYTAEPDLDAAFLRIAATTRSATRRCYDADMDVGFEELKVDWKITDILAYCEGNQGWLPTFRQACEDADVESQESAREGGVILERYLVDRLGAPLEEETTNIERLQCLSTSGQRWLQCGNLFIVLIGKPSAAEPPPDEVEANALIGGLETAINDWNPPWMACLIALSRRDVEEGAFRDDVALPDKDLQLGLLRYVSSSSCREEGVRRAERVSRDLLERRFGNAASLMASQIFERASVEPNSEPREQDVIRHLLHLNAFLCSEDFRRHHLRPGTVFRESEGETYWVCVTPACDMVPRDRSGNRDDPWVAHMDPIRPMLALELELRTKLKKSLKEAARGRHIFFWDRTTEPKRLVVAAVFNTGTNDPNPKLEQMFALNRAKVLDDTFKVQRLVSQLDSDEMQIKTIPCVVVCQLRAPYAERILHVVGYHVSRIGVDFIPMNALRETHES